MYNNLERLWIVLGMLRYLLYPHPFSVTDMDTNTDKVRYGKLIFVIDVDMNLVRSDISKGANG